MADTITIPTNLFFKMRVALAIANSVLEKNRFTGMDQNPKGVRDLVFSASFDADKIDVKETK